MAAFDPEVPLSEEKLVVSEGPPEMEAGFIAKVYGILAAQLLLNAAVALPFGLSEAAKAWIATKGFPLAIMAAVLNLVFLLAMMCPCSCERSKRTFPTSCVLFGFAVTESPFLNAFRGYAPATVLLAGLGAAAQVGGLAAYTFFTKTDFTGMGVYLRAACIVLMIVGMCCLFFHCPFMHKVYCCLGMIVFSFDLVHEMQMRLGSGHCSLTMDGDCALGALQLYVDVLQIFLCVLSLIGDRQ